MNIITALVSVSPCLLFRPMLGWNTLRMDDWNKTADYLNQNKETLYLPGNTTPPDQPHINSGWHTGGEVLITAEVFGYGSSLMYIKSLTSSWDYSTDDSLGHIDRERDFGASTIAWDNNLYFGSRTITSVFGVDLYWSGMSFRDRSIRDNGYEYTKKANLSGFGLGWHIGAQLTPPRLPITLSVQYRFSRINGLHGKLYINDNGTITEWDNARLGFNEQEGRYYFFNWDEYGGMPEGYRDGTLDFSGFYIGIIFSGLGTSACVE